MNGPLAAHPWMPRRPVPAVPVRRRARSWTPAQYLIGIISLQFACQLGLLLFGDTALRFFFRSAVYGLSLLLLLLIRPARHKHPATPIALGILAIVALGLLNPDTPGIIPALGTLALYLAVLAPLWWASALVTDSHGFRSVVFTIWLYQSISALFGVLQVMFPGSFEFQISAVIQEQGAAYLSGLQVTLPSGERIFRPMGLTDTPGGAAPAGLISFILGMGLLITTRNLWMFSFAVISMINALFCIYLSHVRSVLVMAAICVIAQLVVLLIRGGRGGQLVRAAAAAGVVFFLGTIWAFAAGGEQTVARVNTLFAEDPTTVYMRNRGNFLLHTIYVLIPEFPLGAGLGRWGMVQNYLGRFGDGAPPLWAELQLTGWVYDGGVPLAVVYGLAILVACWWTFVRAIDKKLGDLSDWAAVLFGYNVGALAVTFNYPLFAGQGGLEFWMLNAVLFAAVDAVKRRLPAPQARVALPAKPRRMIAVPRPQAR
ncbi:MAG: hypothetical protein NZ561_08680 [Phycisphaerae bacterium]|nr:hypothetical protein [Phycisphaerae bacterium]MDW8261177.1 hypothetical protein [Phycisphaerales bacterium]